MSSIQERKFYLQLWSLTTGPAVKVMKHFFEVKILNNSKFESFLNDQNNMHILFHHCFPTIPCCKCVTVSLASPKKRGCLNSRQFDMLYDNSGLPQPNHEISTGSKVNQYCLCKYSSKRSIKVSGLDITLFNNIIQHCCPSKMNFMWRQSVKDIRNFLAHAGHGKISKADFEAHWMALETATLGFVGEIGDVCEEMFQDEISRILNSSTDQLGDQLKEMLEKSNDDLKNMLDLNGFHPLKTTAEECKTNIKLVHLKQEAHDKQLNRIESSTGQTKDILTQIQLTTKESRREVKHMLNNFESIIKVAVVQAIGEEKGKHMNSENRKINIGTQVDSKSWDEENTLRNLSKIVTTEIDTQSADKEEFHVKSLEHKCIQLELVAFPDVFKNAQTLRKAVKSLINQLVKAGEIDTYIPGKLEIMLTVNTPLTKEELTVVCSVFDKHEMLEESTATEIDVKTNLFNINSITRILKLEPDCLERSDDQSDFTDKDDCVSNQQVKMETTNEGKYDEIFVNVDNLRCLLKLNGLPNDLDKTGPIEVSHDVQGNQLLYLEWTFECPEKWNLPLIVSSINDNISTFPDGFPVDYVYYETTKTFIMHTTAQRSAFISYSSLEAAVVKLIGKIINVSSVSSTEPAELSASVLIMTKPEDGEFFQAKFKKEARTDQSIFGLKETTVICDHCKQSFDCKKCTSKINHIRRQDQALKMKDQTIQRFEKALTKIEKETIEEDESDYDSYYSAEKNTINEEPRYYTGNSVTTRKIEMFEEKSLSPSVDFTNDIKSDQRSEVCPSPPFSIHNAPVSRAYSPSSTVVISPTDGNHSQPQDQNLFKVPSTKQFHSMSASVTIPTSMHLSHPGMAQRSQGEFNTGNQAIRMPAINPPNPMQQSMGIMSTSIQLPQQSGSQQPIQAGIDPGNLSIIPNPPIQGQNKDRKIIWSGMLEYQEKIISNGPTQLKMPRQLQCQLSIGAADPEMGCRPKNYYYKLAKGTYNAVDTTRSLLSSPQFQPLYKSSRQVSFHFGNYNVDSLRNLRRTMSSGFAGCGHFPPGTKCDVLLILFSNKRKAFIGVIPNDQKAFVDGLRNLIVTHKLKQARAQQQAGGSPHQFVQQPQGGLQMGQGMANSQQMQQPGPSHTMTSTGMVTQTSNMVPQAGNMQQLQQQQAMQQKIQEAKLPEQRTEQQLLDEIYFGPPPNMYSAQQRLHQQRLQLHQLHQHQQQAFLQQVSNHQLQQLLLSQQQQGQQIRESPMMMQQQLRGPNSQGQHNVMGGAQQMIPNSMQMGQQGQVMDQDQSNLLDNFDFDDLF